MVGFLDGRLQDVWLDQLFPMLGHNDLLRLRRVCSRTKELTTRYLRTPSNHRSWELRLNSSNQLQDVLAKNLLPPSRLRISALQSEPSFFENELLTEFVNTFGKYITDLELTDITIPLISAKEIAFYESLTNLKSLTIKNLHPAGMAEFETRSKMAGSCLFPPGFRNLKTLQVNKADELSLAWRFINGMGENLEMLSLGYSASRRGYSITLDHLPIQFIERHGKIKCIDYGTTISYMNDLERLRLFEICFRNNIKMENVPANALSCILVDVDEGRIDRTGVMDAATKELIYRVNYQRNGFIGNAIHSLNNLSVYVFLMEVAFFEKLEIKSFDSCSLKIWRRHGYPAWPNLKKLKVAVDMGEGEMANGILRFLWGEVDRPNLEELEIKYTANWGVSGPAFVNPRDIERSCGNLKMLTISNSVANNNFFVALWKGLPMLETVNLINCSKLGNNGFIGNVRLEGTPVFMNLQKLKHLKIEDVGTTTMGNMLINDDLFRHVIRHLKLASFELSSRGILQNRISVDGIKSLLTGEFAESIERLDLNELKLRGVSAEEMKELGSLFRSSRMI